MAALPFSDLSRTAVALETPSIPERPHGRTAFSVWPFSNHSRALSSDNIVRKGHLTALSQDSKSIVRMNRGAQHLDQAVKAWIEQDKEHRTQNGAAEAVGCDSGNFSKILKGERAPGRVAAHKIYLTFGTEPKWFDEAPKADAGDAA